MDPINAAVVLVGCCSAAGCGCATVDPETTTNYYYWDEVTQKHYFTKCSQDPSHAEYEMQPSGIRNLKRGASLVFQTLVSFLGCTYVGHPSSPFDWESENCVNVVPSSFSSSLSQINLESLNIVPCRITSQRDAKHSSSISYLTSQQRNCQHDSSIATSSQPSFICSPTDPTYHNDPGVEQKELSYNFVESSSKDQENFSQHDTTELPATQVPFFSTSSHQSIQSSGSQSPLDPSYVIDPKLGKNASHLPIAECPDTQKDHDSLGSLFDEDCHMIFNKKQPILYSHVNQKPYDLYNNDRNFSKVHTFPRKPPVFPTQLDAVSRSFTSPPSISKSALPQDFFEAPSAFFIRRAYTERLAGKRQGSSMI